MATTHTNRLQAGAIQPIRNEQPAAAAVSTAIKPIEPNDLSEVMTFAQVAVKSQMFGLRTIEEAAARILYGRELGMSVFQSIMGIDMIQGRPGLKAVTVASQIQRSGQYEYRVDKWTVDECTVKFFDRGEFVGAVRCRIRLPLQHVGHARIPFRQHHGQQRAHGPAGSVDDVHGGRIALPVSGIGAKAKARDPGPLSFQCVEWSSDPIKHPIKPGDQRKNQARGHNHKDRNHRIADPSARAPANQPLRFVRCLG